MSLVEPSSFLNLSSSLISFSIRNAALQGNFPNNVFHLPHLQELSFEGNNLTGTLPNFNWSSSLWSLDLSWTSFSGELPDSIGNLKSLKNLNLQGCKFTNSIPASLGNLTQITVIDLYYNNFVGLIPSSFSNLVQLTVLDLSFNNFAGQIPDVFGNFSKIIDLCLSDNNFNGQLPSSAFNLKQPYDLDLSANKLEGNLPDLVSGLSNLTSLKLGHNLLNGKIPSWLFTLPSLQFLDLANNKLIGLSDQFQQPNALEEVYLGNNELQGSIPSSIFYLLNVRVLQLSSNNLSGIIEPHMLSKLENLQMLDLSHNSLLSFRGNNSVNYTFPNLMILSFSSCNISEFPDFLGRLENLVVLDLSSNQINGQIFKRELEGWQSLTYLNISYNNLTGLEQLPGKNLRFVDLRSNLLEGPLPIPPPSVESYLLSNNNLSGEIPSLICNLRSLVVLDLSSNRLHGMIPECLGNFSNDLLVLNLRMNNFHGKVPGTFSKGNSLRNLALYGNQLEGPLPQSLVHCSKLKILDLGSNKINDTFPHWLESIPELQVLVLRSNRFHGQIGNPKSRFSFTKLRTIDLSHNEFNGLLPTRLFENLQAMMNVNDQKVERKYMGDTYYEDSVVMTRKRYEIEAVEILTIFTIIDLSSNQFEGPLPVPPPSLEVYLVANNRLSGEIPSLICNLSSLLVLDLSNNSLSGILPKCLGNFSNKLSVLNLQMNNFIGSIPGPFSVGNRLRNLGLNSNQLEGPLPRSLVHCSKLEVLDLGNNKINDTFPLWLESLPQLQVLNLRSNRLHGQIGNSKNRNSFTNLRIVDLSHNDFTGLLPPRLLENLQAMMMNADEQNVEKKYMGDGYYQDYVIITMKGLELKLRRILTIFTTIDLSSNRFQGQIPKVFGKFKSLLVLNISHNSLTGKIPSSLGNITALQSLDLSWNKLVGKIPMQLTSLTFLEVLNLSHNHLVGPIPRGGQFDTFENDSYSGNSGLCELPLSEKCSNDGAPQPLLSISHEEEDFRAGFDWKITMMGYGCGLVFGLSMGYIVFSTGKPQWFIRLVEGDRHKKVRRPRQTHQER